MARVKWQVASRRRRKRLLGKAKGYYGARSKHIRRAKETVMRALAYATRDRKVRKREFRSLWIIRLNAAARSRGLTYSRLMDTFRRAKIGLDRKQLAELALNDEAVFNQLVETAAKAAANGDAAPARAERGEAGGPAKVSAKASKKTAKAAA